MREEIDTPDARVARIAERQHGVVTAEQLREVGIDKSAVTRRVKAGRLHRLHRGVYAVGHRAPSWHGRWMAAVLACDEGAVLSHHSAAVLWELLRPIDGPIHVSVPTTTGRISRQGIRLHRCPRSLPGATKSPSPRSSARSTTSTAASLLTSYEEPVAKQSSRESTSKAPRESDSAATSRKSSTRSLLSLRTTGCIERWLVLLRRSSRGWRRFGGPNRGQDPRGQGAPCCASPIRRSKKSPRASLPTSRGPLHRRTGCRSASGGRRGRCRGRRPASCRCPPG